jgi:hypothetical protein
MFSQFTPKTSFRKKAKHRRLEPLTARAGSSGAGFFHHVKEVRRVSPSIAPGRAPEARSRKQFSAPGLDGGAALAVKTSRCARPYGLRIKFFSCPPRRPSMLCTQETPTKGAIMGLDMTAYAVPAGASKGEQFHYWRKHHELLKWCAALDVERGGAAWDEPAQSVILTSADLDRLESAVVKGEVRDVYDRADYWQAHDLEFIAKARAALAAGMMVEIVASW